MFHWETRRNFKFLEKLKNNFSLVHLRSRSLGSSKNLLNLLSYLVRALKNGSVSERGVNLDWPVLFGFASKDEICKSVVIVGLRIDLTALESTWRFDVGNLKLLVLFFEWRKAIFLAGLSFFVKRALFAFIFLNLPSSSWQSLYPGALVYRLACCPLCYNLISEFNLLAK